MPPVPGLDGSIVIKPERLHLTLGVMSLSSPRDKSWRPLRVGEQCTENYSNSSENIEQTTESALSLLRSLSEPLAERLSSTGSPLSINFAYIDTMKPPRGTAAGEAHVLWAGPENSLNGGDENRKLHEICNFIRNSFKTAGYIVEDRPLKLHCTLVNTIHRKKPKRDYEGSLKNQPLKAERRGGRDNDRIPFSYDAICESEAIKAIALNVNSSEVNLSPETGATVRQPMCLQPIKVRLDAYPLLSLELCEMGSYDEIGGYRSIGGISLVPKHCSLTYSSVSNEPGQ